MSSNLKEIWEEWELRALVLLSLTIQVLLIILGHHRKYRPDLWLKALVWVCYLSADAVAIYTLGKIATRLKQIGNNSPTAKGMDPNAQMTAFWAPFLLLHLGGPDTITAYALEDNELWMRHLLGLVVQTTGTLYIFFQALTSYDDLLVLSLLMMVSGLIKYGERVYVLRAASSEHRDSIPGPPLRYSKILEEYKMKETEGYDVTPHEVIEVRGVNTKRNLNAGIDLSSPDKDLLSDAFVRRQEPGRGTLDSGTGSPDSQSGDPSTLEHDHFGTGSLDFFWSSLVAAARGTFDFFWSSLVAAARDTFDFFQRLFGNERLLPEKMKERNRAELAIAKDLIDIFQRLFADLVLSFEDRDTSMSVLEDKHFHVVFRVIEIELGFMYNFLYTKMMVIQSRWGFTLRSLSVLVTVIVSVLFSWSDKDKYFKPNIYVTFLLLWVAIFLEIYALFVLLFSDEAACWLNDHSCAILDLVERVQPLYNRRRWAGSMAQHNLLSFALKEKHPTCHPILEWLHVDQKILKFLYKGNSEITDYLKERLLNHFKSQAGSEKEVQSVKTYPGYLVLEKHELWDDFKWSIELEFDQSIHVWHIATELLCHPEIKEDAPQMSKQLSRYMLYLLVMYPFLLPVGAARIRFQDIYAVATRLLKEPESKKKTRTIVESESNITEACNELRKNVNTQLAPIMTKGDKSKFTLYQGCRLASQLNEAKYTENKWDIVSSVWVEMLVYAAVTCKGIQHARQLRRGGEFLTHVWFLMAHFGLTDHFKIPHVPAIAELLVKQE